KPMRWKCAASHPVDMYRWPIRADFTYDNALATTIGIQIVNVFGVVEFCAANVHVQSCEHYRYHSGRSTPRRVSARTLAPPRHIGISDHIPVSDVCPLEFGCRVSVDL